MQFTARGSGVVGSIGTVLQIPTTPSPDCWACVLDRCNGVPVHCNDPNALKLRLLNISTQQSVELNLDQLLQDAP